MSEDQAKYNEYEQNISADAVSADYCPACEPFPGRAIEVNGKQHCLKCGRLVRSSDKLPDAPKPKKEPWCVVCGSWAINPKLHGRDDSDLHLCDVCYWRQRAGSMRSPEEVIERLDEDAPKPGSVEDTLWEIFSLGTLHQFYAGHRLIADDHRGRAAKIIKELCAMRSPEEVRKELERAEDEINRLRYAGIAWARENERITVLKWMLREEE